MSMAERGLIPGRQLHQEIGDCSPVDVSVCRVVRFVAMLFLYPQDSYADFFGRVLSGL
jgi:hypothetical protein